MRFFLPHFRQTLASLILLSSALQCQANLESRLENAHESQLERVRNNFHSMRDPYRIPPKGKIVLEEQAYESQRKQFTWQRDVPVTIFWVGEDASQNNPVHNHASSWNPNWMRDFGGVDDPDNRNGYFPAGFMPRLNPFYIALPYNDIAAGGGRFKPEASRLIEWFRREAKVPGRSVCKDRWIAIHKGHKVCYAQWKDCGPFYTDDYADVFQGKRPKPNRNGNAGLDISPAVRDFLGVKSGELVSWKFVENEDVLTGPWARWMKEEG